MTTNITRTVNGVRVATRKVATQPRLGRLTGEIDGNRQLVNQNRPRVDRNGQTVVCDQKRPIKLN